MWQIYHVHGNLLQAAALHNEANIAEVWLLALGFCMQAGQR
jgi:hypothetical protein